MELKMIHTIVLFVLLSRVSNVQGQCKRPHFTGNQILRSNAEDFPEGSETRLNCATGYIPVSQSSSRYVTCKNSEWTEPELQCKKKTCGSPGEIQHGRYLIPEKDGILFGAVITAECNKGYRLASRSNTRNCQSNGWDGRPPICEAVRCESPASLPHLTFEPMQDSYEFGEAIKYSCLNRLILIGEKISSCTADGTFQPAPPECRSVSCNRPFIPHAFKIGGKSPPYEYKNFVQYECDEGHKMNGSSYLICEENGWNPKPPECNIVTCPKLPLIDHGKYEPDRPTYEYKNKITYSCDPCFKLSGPEVKICSKNEYFTPTHDTTCIEVNCSRPSLSNGDFQPQKLSYECGELITYHCNRGYKMKGNAKSSCSDEGFTLPKCEIWTCRRPQVKKGEVSSTKLRYNYGESLEFSCKLGFKLIGPTSIKCLENEKFDHPPPTCKEITCEAPDIINGERQGGPIYKYNKFVEYKCDEGYKMDGSNKMTCKQQGWDRRLPQCNKITCEAPDIINGKKLGGPIHEYNSSVEYKCDKGYTMNGSKKMTCTQQGWDGLPPQCNKITCEAPDIDNGKRLGGPIYEYNSMVEYKCDDGYTMYGSNNMTCKSQGWDGLPPQCKKITCEAPDIINGKSLGGPIYELNSLVKFKCDKGYAMYGSYKMICKPQGWIGRRPQCIKKAGYEAK